MKINIDASLMTRDGAAIGRIHGAINLPSIPFTGSSISFMYPKEPATFPSIDGFSGLVNVSAVQYAANCDSSGILLLLENIVVASRNNVAQLEEFLRSGFGLFLEIYDYR